MRGTMLWFHEGKDYGFISTENDERLYVHGTGFAEGIRPRGRCAELAVTFVVASDNGTRRAEEVVFVEDVAPRRARLRHGAGRGRH
jgi:cold shock CspA family protein